jgi:hypothetical protein
MKNDDARIKQSALTNVHTLLSKTPPVDFLKIENIVKQGMNSKDKKSIIRS